MLNGLSEAIVQVLSENIDLIERLNDVKIMTEFSINREHFLEVMEKNRYTQDEVDAISDRTHPHKERTPSEMHRSDVQEEDAEDFLSLLMMYGSVIKNAELLDNSDRVEHLEYYLYGINMLYAMMVFLYDYVKEHIKYDGLSNKDKVELAVSSEEEFEKKKARISDMTKLLFPIAVQNLALENVGTPKLEVAINELIERKKDKPFEKFMLTFLKCDLKIVNLKSLLKKYIREEKSKDILKIVMMKLAFYYQYRFFGYNPQQDRDIIDLIADINVKLNSNNHSGFHKSEIARKIKFQMDNKR